MALINSPKAFRLSDFRRPEANLRKAPNNKVDTRSRCHFDQGQNALRCHAFFGKKRLSGPKAWHSNVSPEDFSLSSRDSNRHRRSIKKEILSRRNLINFKEAIWRVENWNRRLYVCVCVFVYVCVCILGMYVCVCVFVYMWI